MALHTSYGGVVPELASRREHHLATSSWLIREAMSRQHAAEHPVTFADLRYRRHRRPGLAGALLVGITYAQAIPSASTRRPPDLGQSPRGHIRAVLMEARDHALKPQWNSLFSPSSSPAARICTTRNSRRATARTYRNVGRTVDDAAGEAYDKVAELLGLGYPGETWIDRARLPTACWSTLLFAEINPPDPRPGVYAERRTTPSTEGPHFDFSFSGIKTAVAATSTPHHLRASIDPPRSAAGLSITPKDTRPPLHDQQTLDLHRLLPIRRRRQAYRRRAFAAAEALGARNIVVLGGVAPTNFAPLPGRSRPSRPVLARRASPCSPS